MKRAVIMCRVSSDEQAKGYSLDVQFEQLSSYCSRNSIEICKHYKEDHSAKDFNRPEFQKFLQYSKKNKGEIDLLLITSWDRFSRNITDALLMIRKLKSLGIEVQAIEQPIDMSIPENKAMLAIFLAIPEIDNDRRSIKIKGGVRAAMKAGRWCRKSPFGYRNTRDAQNKPIIVPSEKAEYVRYLYEEFAKGKSQADIRREIYKQGVNISRNNMSLMLRNPVYIGKIVVPACNEEEEVWVDGVHEGIIDEKLFYQVQDLLSKGAKRRRYPSKHKMREEFPLRGILSCSNCGEKMTASNSRGRSGIRYPYYHCNHCKKDRYRAEIANITIETILSDFSFTKQSKELYDLMVKSLISGGKKNNTKKKESLQKVIETNTKRLERLQDLFVDGEISHSDFTKATNRYSKAKKEAESELAEIGKENLQYKSWLKKGVNALSDLSKHYKNGTLLDKQSLLGSIFPEKLEFDGEKCRTTRLNDVLRFILQIDKGLGNKKRGQFSNNLGLSSLVDLSVLISNYLIE